IVETFGDATGAISTWFNTQFEGVDWVGVIRGGIAKLASAIGDAIGGMASFLTTFYTWMTEQINSVDWNGVGQLVGNLLGLAIKGAIGLILLAGDLFVQIISELGEVDWGSLASAFWGYLKAAAIAAIDLLIGIGQGIWDSLSGELSGLDWDAVWMVVFSPFMGLIETATDAWNDFMGLIGQGSDESDTGGAGTSGDRNVTEGSESGGGTSVFGDSGVTRTTRTSSGDGKNFPSVPKLGGWVMAQVAVDLFRKSLEALRPAAQQSTIDMNAIASTAPVVGGAVTAADGAVKGASAGIGASFTAIAASALANFTATQVAGSTQFGALASTVAAQSASANVGATSQFSSMNAGVSGQIGSLASTVASQSANANRNATSNFSSMSASAAGKFLGMQAQSAVQMAIMATTASTKGNQTTSNLVGALAGGVARVAAASMGWVGAVRGGGNAAASTAYGIGANVSSSFASGMYSALGSIQAAAAAMVAAANTALRAKAMIASPSKLFKRLGGYVGEGFALGIGESGPGVQRAIDGLFGTAMPSPAFGAPIHGGGVGGGTQVINNYYQQDVKVMTSAEWEAYKQKSERGNAVADHLAMPRNGSGFERGVR
ncbi:MAG: hypothetical protein K5924_12590, partial [Chloroflexi bacterium]|nr:hypothetical protein [Chloroflexota bacterium]